MKCPVCDAEPAGAQKVFGLRLGERCAAGELAQLEAGRGWKVSVSQRDEPHRDANGRVIGELHRLDLTLEGGLALSLEASFRREGALQKVRKVLIREPQVGDPAFDDLVYIKGADGVALRALLATAARDAIRELVLLGGTVEVKASCVHVVAKQADVIDLPAWTVPALCLKAWASGYGGTFDDD